MRLFRSTSKTKLRLVLILIEEIRVQALEHRGKPLKKPRIAGCVVRGEDAAIGTTVKYYHWIPYEVLPLQDSCSDLKATDDG